MLKVALTGSTGLIGTRIINLLSKDFVFIPLLQSEIDITEKTSLNDKLKKTNFDILLHLAAYTNVDEAENNKDIAYKINVLGTKNVFNFTQKSNKKLIYISTDFVFDGNHPPYDEESMPAPISYYGKTKLEGETIVKNHAMIVRLSYPYCSHFAAKKDIVRSIKSRLEQNKELFMVADSIITPTFIDDIAYSLKYLLENFDTRTYHLVGADSLSPFEFGLQVAQYFNLNKKLIKPITYQEYFKDKAKRPKYSIIKTVNNNFYQMKSSMQGLKAVVKQLEIDKLLFKQA